MVRSLSNKREDFILSLIFSLLFFAVLFPLLHIAPIGSSSEAREVHIARIMYQSGEWILPLRDGLLPSKPPLFHWLTAGIGALRGSVDPFTARFVSLIFASGVMFLTVFISLKFSSADNKKQTALTAALILGSSYGFTRLSVDSRVDMAFCFFITLAVTFIVLPLSPQAQKYSVDYISQGRISFICFYLSCVLAVLTKGPLGIIFPVLCGFSITAYFYGFKKSLKLWFSNMGGVLIFLLTAPVWYYLAYQKAGYDFISKQLLFENVSRFTGDGFYKVEPAWFYIPSFIRSIFPWSLGFLYFAVQGLIIFFKKKISDKDAIFIIWVLSGLIFFSLAHGKRHAYIVPLFIPAAIYLTVKLNNRQVLSIRFKEIFKNSMLLLLMAAAGAVLFVQYFKTANPLLINARTWALKHQYYLLYSCFSGAIAAIIFAALKLDQFWRRDVMAVVCLQAFIALGIMGGLGIKNNLKNFEETAASINSIVKPDDKIFAIREKYEELIDPVLFYLNREAPIMVPSQAKFTCGSYYILESKYLSLNSDLQVRGEYYEIPDKLKKDPDRDIVLAYLSCSGLV